MRSTRAWQEFLEGKYNTLTAGELVAFLQTLPPETRIGRVGHFGEPYGMSVSDFNVRQIGQDMTIVDISPPDIGEKPD